MKLLLGGDVILTCEDIPTLRSSWVAEMLLSQISPKYSA